MKVHEYQAKELLAQFGVPVPRGRVASSPEEARQIAGVLARHPDALLKTMVEKELGIATEQHGDSPLRGALFMGGAFGAGAAVPILPYVFLPMEYAAYGSVAATALVLFGIGVVKARWTRRNPIVSGLEILIIAAIAGIAGYFFGSILPPDKVDLFLLPILGLIIFLSIAPTAWHLYKENKQEIHALVRSRMGRPG